MALERCGRRDEALRLCDEVQVLPSADDTVLCNLKVVYRRCRQLSAIARMWEAASKKEPDNDELAERHFFALLRLEDHAAAQKVATKLFSKTKREKYVHWAVVAMLAQVRAGGSPQVLDFAALMLQKAPLNLDGLDGGEVSFSRTRLKALLLELETLRMRKKFEEALQLLEKCKEVVKYEPDVAALRISLLVEAGRPKEAAALAKARFLAAPGEWGFAQEYIQLAFECPAPEAAPRRRCTAVAGQPEIVDHAARLRPAGGGALPCAVSAEDLERLSAEDEVFNAAVLIDFLRAQADTSAKGEAASAAAAGACRVARLARLELRRRALAAAEGALAAAAAAATVPTGCSEGVPWDSAASAEDVEALLSDIKEFVTHFAGKAHCFFDLKPFLCLLPDSVMSDLVAVARVPEDHDSRRAAEAAKTAARLARALQRGGRGGAEEVRALLAGAAGGLAPPEELLLLAVTRLADLGRGGEGHLLDAIAVAELGIEWYPQAYNFKALLVLLNGRLGLPNTMMKWYSQMAVKNGQHESASFMAFDELCLSGDHEQLLDVARCILGFHEDVDKDGDEALALAYNGSSLHRSAEYLESLQLRARSLIWGRALVEETFCELGQAQTWEAVLEALSRQGILIDGVKARADDYWSQRSQDRNILFGLHPLPLCTPLGMSGFSAQAWRRPGGGIVPTASLQGSHTEGLSSAVVLWGQPLGEAAPSTSSRHQPSLVEEQMVRGLQFSPAELTLSAAMLSLLAALLRPEGANAEQALAALGVVRASADRAGLVAEVGAVGETARRRALRLAVAACEVAGAALRSTAGEEPWELTEGRLAAVTAEVAAMAAALATKAGSGAAPFAFGCRASTEALWAWLHSGLTVVLPLASGLTTVFPKVGKKKDGSEGLHATRVALRSLLAALQTAFADVQLLLASALQAPAPDLPDSGLLSSLAGGPERRAAAARDAVEAHRRHLRKLQETVAGRAALLKARGAFKP